MSVKGECVLRVLRKSFTCYTAADMCNSKPTQAVQTAYLKVMKACLKHAKSMRGNKQSPAYSCISPPYLVHKLTFPLEVMKKYSSVATSVTEVITLFYLPLLSCRAGFLSYCVAGQWVI